MGGGHQSMVSKATASPEGRGAHSARVRFKYLDAVNTEYKIACIYDITIDTCHLTRNRTAVNLDRLANVIIMPNKAGKRGC